MPYCPVFRPTMENLSQNFEWNMICSDATKQQIFKTKI